MEKPLSRCDGIRIHNDDNYSIQFNSPNLLEKNILHTQGPKYYKMNATLKEPICQTKTYSYNHNKVQNHLRQGLRHIQLVYYVTCECPIEWKKVLRWWIRAA